MYSATSDAIGERVLHHCANELKLEFYPGDFVLTLSHSEVDDSPQLPGQLGMVNTFLRLEDGTIAYAVQDDVLTHRGELAKLLLEGEPFRIVDAEYLRFARGGIYRQYLASLTDARSMFGATNWQQELSFLVSVGMARRVGYYPRTDATLMLLQELLNQQTAHAFDEALVPYWIENFDASQRIVHEALHDLRGMIEDAPRNGWPAGSN